MESKMVFSREITGEIDVEIDCDDLGRAKPGCYDSFAKLLTGVGTMDVTTCISFEVAGNPPSGVTLTCTAEDEPKYTTIINITSPANGTGTGTIYDKFRAAIGTLTINATGGTVTVGSTTEAFTF